MSREYTNKLFEMLEEESISYEVVLKEMLSYFSEDDIKEFCLTSFGNEGIFNLEEEEEEEEEALK